MIKYLMPHRVRKNMRTKLTDPQYNLIVALDDTSEHVSWEFESDEYNGPSTLGFAHIDNVDGRCSFIRNIKSMSALSRVDWITESNNRYMIEIGGLNLSVRNSNSGYRISIDNVKDYVVGPEYQRLDVQERLHNLVLHRLQIHGYLKDARVYTKMD